MTSTMTMATTTTTTTNRKFKFVRSPLRRKQNDRDSSYQCHEEEQDNNRMVHRKDPNNISTDNSDDNNHRQDYMHADERFRMSRFRRRPTFVPRHKSNKQDSVSKPNEELKPHEGVQKWFHTKLIRNSGNRSSNQKPNDDRDDNVGRRRDVSVEGVSKYEKEHQNNDHDQSRTHQRRFFRLMIGKRRLLSRRRLNSHDDDKNHPKTVSDAADGDSSNSNGSTCNTSLENSYCPDGIRYDTTRVKTSSVDLNESENDVVDCGNTSQCHHHPDIVLGPLLPSPAAHDEISRTRYENTEVGAGVDQIPRADELRSKTTTNNRPTFDQLLKFTQRVDKAKIDIHVSKSTQSTGYVGVMKQTENHIVTPLNQCKVEKQWDGASTNVDRSEMIKKLFPLGHPSAKNIEKPATTIPTNRYSREALEVGLLILQRRERGREAMNAENIVLRCRKNNSSTMSLDGTVESLLCDTSTVDSSSGSHSDKGIQRQQQNDKSDNTWKQENQKAGDFKDAGVRSPNHGVVSSDIIGKVISFDPTWDLLEMDRDDSLCAAWNRRSKLQKIHQIENYVDSLLGKLDDMDSPAEFSVAEQDDSVNQLFDEIDSCDGSISLSFGSLHLRDEPFELGCHFHPVTFPDVSFGSNEETEIVFVPEVKPTTGFQARHSIDGMSTIQSECHLHESVFGYDCDSTSSWSGTGKIFTMPVRSGNPMTDELSFEFRPPVSPVESDGGRNVKSFQLDTFLPLPTIHHGTQAHMDVLGIDDQSDSIPSCYCSTDTDDEDLGYNLGII